MGWMQLVFLTPLTEPWHTVPGGVLGLHLATASTDVELAATTSAARSIAFMVVYMV